MHRFAFDGTRATEIPGQVFTRNAIDARIIIVSGYLRAFSADARFEELLEILTDLSRRDPVIARSRRE